MTTYGHKKIAEAIVALDQPPNDPTSFSEWIKAGNHLEYLEQNGRNEEMIVYASGPYSFVHSIALPAEALEGNDLEKLLSWSTNPFTSIASYVYGGGRDTMWIERGDKGRGSPLLANGIDLIFMRTFEGWSGRGKTYLDLNQEYTHLSGIHWRPERHAYCKFDDNGDLTDIVSTTLRDNQDDIALVTFAWAQLEEYLSLANYVLVRMFDFTLLRRGEFDHWGDEAENIIRISDDFLYRQKVVGKAAYTRGIQIIRPRDAKTISKNISAKWMGNSDREYATFIADDWRNKKIRDISTDPVATTNYFEASKNDLPFELSPAFFRPEVLSKYKTDREKYSVDDRDIHCRAAWGLRAYDVNEAGQVFAYICYLRDLPYSEQLHWKSYNEAPKAGISERALINDFHGDFVSYQHPRSQMLSIVQRWKDRSAEWWRLTDESLLDRANPPISSSKDEWSEAIMDISKLVIEGFDIKCLRSTLDKLNKSYTSEEKSISLLEKIIGAKSTFASKVKLEGLRTVQHIRSKVKGHSGSSESQSLAQDALTTYGTYGDHFKHVCKQAVDDMQKIEQSLGL